jgi:hypothetical protein
LSWAKFPSYRARVEPHFPRREKIIAGKNRARFSNAAFSRLVMAFFRAGFI